MASPEMLNRAAQGLVDAAFIAAGARQVKSLDTSGAVAATVVGMAAAAAGWDWAALLILYFVSSSLLSRFRKGEKERATAGMIEKGGARDAKQVIANGGIFAASALIAPFGPPLFTTTMSAAALGALASSAADTWATEIGTLFGGTPRSLRGFRAVPIGTSGALSLSGSIAMITGASFVAAFASWFGVSPRYLLIGIAGIVGALADSILGATLQSRRWCDTCNGSSEKRVHDCGSATRAAGGHEWMDNDLVNLLATFIGATVAAFAANL